MGKFYIQACGVCMCDGLTSYKVRDEMETAMAYMEHKIYIIKLNLMSGIKSALFNIKTSV